MQTADSAHTLSINKLSSRGASRHACSIDGNQGSEAILAQGQTPAGSTAPDARLARLELGVVELGIRASLDAAAIHLDQLSSASFAQGSGSGASSFALLVTRRTLPCDVQVISRASLHTVPTQTLQPISTSETVAGRALAGGALVIAILARPLTQELPCFALQLAHPSHQHTRAFIQALLFDQELTGQTPGAGSRRPFALRTRVAASPTTAVGEEGAIRAFLETVSIEIDPRTHAGVAGIGRRALTTGEGTLEALVIEVEGALRTFGSAGEGVELEASPAFGALEVALAFLAVLRTWLALISALVGHAGTVELALLSIPQVPLLALVATHPILASGALGQTVQTSIGLLVHPLRAVALSAASI